MKRTEFPTVTLGERYVYFNRLAVQFIPSVGRWVTTPEYVLFLPAVAGGEDANRVWDTASGKETNFARHLREKRIKKGCYRLYKYKDGVAFKRYEQIA